MLNVLWCILLLLLLIIIRIHELTGHRLWNREYRESSIKPQGNWFISSPFKSGGGGLIETGGLFEGGGLFNLEKILVTLLHKEIEYKAEKHKYKKVGGHAAEDHNQIRTSIR